MSDQSDKLRASKPAAQAAKEAIKSRYATGRDDLAVGLGLNSSGDDWAVMVFAQTPGAAQAIPDHYGDFAVEIQVTGPVRSY